MPRALVLDVDGVLVRPAATWGAVLAREYELSREETAPFFRGPFRDCLAGRADLRQVITPFLQEWRWQHGADAFLRAWFEAEHAVDMDLIAVVREMRARGVVCALATNQERYRLEYLRGAMGLADEFDAVIASCEAGCVKPDAPFYEYVERSMRAGPADVAFWDDTPGHVEAARARGWAAHVFEGVDAFRKQLFESFGDS
jgi:putative hydrolase of the HAD superfamily